MADEKPRNIPLVPELTVTLLCSPVANKSLLTSDLASSLSASLIELKTMFVTLCFQKLNCNSSHGLLVDCGSELKQFGCFVLLLSQHYLLLLRQMRSVLLFPPQNGNDVV